MNLLKDDNGVAFGIVGESGSSAKIYYSLKNQLMSEHQNIIDAPNSFEIPKEVNTLEKMNLYAKENGGILFFPTNSIADLKDDSHVIQEAILANCNTTFFLKKEESVHVSAKQVQTHANTFGLDGLEHTDK